MNMQMMIFFQGTFSKEKNKIANIIFLHNKTRFKHFFNTSDKTHNAINPKYIKNATKSTHHQVGHKQGRAAPRVSQSFPHKPSA